MSRCKQSEEPGALLSWFWREQHEWEAKNEKQKISDTENTADVFYGIKMKNTKPGTLNRKFVPQKQHKGLMFGLTRV